jgi:hypothetical protein
MSSCTDRVASNGVGRRDPSVRALALLPTIGMLRLTGLLLGLPGERLKYQVM